MATVIKDDSFISRRDAAQMLGVQAQTLAKWSCARTGPVFHRIGRAVRYRRSDLEKWLAASRVVTADQK